jgi:hypothetical protein
MTPYTPNLSDEIVLLILEQVCLPFQTVPKRELIFNHIGLTDFASDIANIMSCLSAILSAINFRLVPIHHSSVMEAVASWQQPQVGQVG